MNQSPDKTPLEAKDRFADAAAEADAYLIAFGRLHSNAQILLDTCLWG